MYIFCSIFILFAVSCVYCDVAFSEKDVINMHLDLANTDLISKERRNVSVGNFIAKSDDDSRPMDCADLFEMGYFKSGIYRVWPMSRVLEGKSVRVFCDMKTSGGGWTVIQRRGDFGRAKDYFYQDWKNYKEGFGNIDEDFWLGNDNIFALTSQKLYSVRFDLKDVEQIHRYALYDKFWIDDENNKYMLHITDYRGDAGDSMVNHNNKKFTTKDQDNDDLYYGNCAHYYKGGWWYHQCHEANLNGMYYKGKHTTWADGVMWNTFRGAYEALETTEIKIRPKKFRPNISRRK